MQTYRHPDIQTGIQTKYRHTDTQTSRHPDIKTGRQTYRHRDIET